MARITDTQLQTLDYGYLGQPFCYMPAKTAIVLKTLDYGYLGQPFATGVEEGVAPPANTGNFFFFFN